MLNVQLYSTTPYTLYTGHTSIAIQYSEYVLRIAFYSQEDKLGLGARDTLA